MNLEQAREAYQDFSARASEIARYMALAGFGIIWIFTIDLSEGKNKVPEGLIPVAIGLAVALLLDFLQYVYGAVAWGWYGRYREKRGTKPDDEFEAPAWINRATIALFALKLVVMVVAYVLLLDFLWTRVT